MDIATNNAIQRLTTQLEALRKQIRQKPNLETGGHWITLGPYKNLSPFSAGTEEPFMTAVPSDATLRQIRIGAYVATTNSGSHYWSIVFKAGPNTIVNLNTSGMSANTWTLLTANYGDMSTTDVVTGNVYFYVSLSKTGTPGNLSLASPVIYFV